MERKFPVIVFPVLHARGGYVAPGPFPRRRVHDAWIEPADRERRVGRVGVVRGGVRGVASELVREETLVWVGDGCVVASV